MDFENLIATNPLEAAKQLCKKVDTDKSLEIEDLERIILSIGKDETFKGLLIIERNTFLALKPEYLEASKLQYKQLKYKIFDLEPLKWRNEKGFPRLAVFDIDAEPHFEIRVYNGGHQITFKGLPKEVKQCFLETVNYLARIKELDKTISIRAEFKGFIPQDVRKEIALVERLQLFKEIYIIADVSEWEIDETATPNKDPLVVGYDGKFYWLIASFDTTSIEEYIRAEFCV